MIKKEIPADIQAAITACKERIEQQEKEFDLSTIAGQKAKLKALGEQERAAIEKEQNPDGNQEKITYRALKGRRIVANLKKVVTFAILGDDETELEAAPLVFYNVNKGVYSQSQRTIEQFILAVESTATIRTRKEVLGWLRLEAKARKVCTDPHLIPVGNGVYNDQTSELRPYSPETPFANKSDTNYTPTATEPIINGWKPSDLIDDIGGGDPEKTTLIKQMIATTVKNRQGKSVMFYLTDDGQGGTGKSTLMQLLINLVGKDNVKALTLREFDNDFKLAQAYGARVIIGDENQVRGFIDDGSNLKTIVTNGVVLINPKSKGPFSAKFNATVIQAGNDLPKFRDTSGGLYRRFRMINFPDHHPDTPENRLIGDDYIYRREVLEWFMKEALNTDVSQIVDTQESRELVHTTRLDNNPVLYFYENYVKDTLTSTRLPMKFLFAYFRAVMDNENNATRLTQNSFTRRIKPIAEADGWQYSKKNYKVMEQFTNHDLNLVKDLDQENNTDYHYRADVDRNEYQPLLIKEPDPYQQQ